MTRQNNFTQIPNEMIEALYSLKISSRKFRILLFIIRQTLGYGHNEHKMSLGYIGKALDMRRHHVLKDLADLANDNIIKIQKNSGITPQIITLNKNCDEWVLPKQVTVTQIGNCYSNEEQSVTQTSNTTVTQIGNTTVTQMGNKINKESNKESNKDKKIKNTLHIPDFFPLLLSTYPNKMNRDGVTADAFEEIEQAGKGTLLKAITNYKRYIEENKDWYHPMNAASFFNGRWKDFVEDDKTEDDKTEPIYTEDGVMLE